MNRWNDVVTSKGFRFESDLGFLNNVHILIRPEEYMKVIIYITRIKKYMYIYFVYISKYNFIIPFFFLSYKKKYMCIYFSTLNTSSS